MKVKNLSSLQFEKIISCFLEAFQNYFVTLPDDVEYWRNRFAAVKVDWELSFGMFEGERLVGFIINGVGNHNGKLTAYNTGTGVLNEYRGQQIVNALYAHAFPDFRQKGIEKCLLEVISENSRALKVYERIGFEILRKLGSYTGTISPEGAVISLERVNYQEILDLGLYKSGYYAWEGSAETILNSEDLIQTYLFKEGGKIGYFCIDKNSNVLQLDCSDPKLLIRGIAQVSKNAKFKNLSEERKEIISEILSAGLTNAVNQYEMELVL